jgi:hypothetical protein
MVPFNELIDCVVDLARCDAMGHTYFGSHCVDCGTNCCPAVWEGPTVLPALPQSWEFYWVKDEVWSAAGMGELDGSLCVGCLEARLGRRLRRKDFDFSRSENQIPRHYITPLLAERQAR